ncbi:YraN family protein [Sedimentimonas flavescens]|uniref:YraN family protein n=1 Tax=Sedimentimonas flavescens TaxID=2851012 RepID=UPI001C49FF7F|nr:YraN family protein [Sedimentimonas flavescens]MBW0156724.1 YraN family protein [Sedimentimonas flavescens]
MSGALSYHAGAAAEEQVARHYEAAGFEIVARRWRGRYGGEVDLIARRGSLLAFVEVKFSRTHEVAATHLLPRQLARIFRSADEYLALGHIQAEESRFDLALVDAQGRVAVIENAAQAD